MRQNHWVTNDGAGWFLNRLIGQSKAKALMYLAERGDAEECARLGLMNAVFEPDSFRDESFAYAKRLANGATVALSRMKRNINRGGMRGLRESLAPEAEHMVQSFQTENAAEAILAFIEKREPQFRFRSRRP